MDGNARTNEGQDDQRAQNLRQARAQNTSAKTDKKKPADEGEIDKLEKLVANKHKTPTFVFIGIFAFIGSTLGAIPFIGWLISLGTAGGMSLCYASFEGDPRKKAQLLNAGGVAVNLIAAAFGVDAIPEQAVILIITWILVQKSAHKAEKRLEEMGSTA